MTRGAQEKIGNVEPAGTKWAPGNYTAKSVKTGFLNRTLILNFFNKIKVFKKEWFCSQMHSQDKNIEPSDL